MKKYHRLPEGNLIPTSSVSPPSSIPTERTQRQTRSTAEPEKLDAAPQQRARSEASLE
jgi:hypothetical protein